MNTLVLVIQLALATLAAPLAPSQTVQACWMPTAGLFYEVWVAMPGGAEWTQYRQGIKCVANTLCCVDGLVYAQSDTAWMVVAKRDAIGSGEPTATSTPMVVPMAAATGRWTSTASVAAPILKGVTP